MPSRLPRFVILLALVCVPSACRVSAQDGASLPAVDLDSSLTLERIVPQLAAKRVVFVGEEHDRYDHHLNQLEIIRRLHDLDPNLAIGVEYFQQRFQPQVDDYVAGRTTEDQFLRAIDYYRTWGYDYRLYAPLFRFAREQRIPVRALNVPGSLPSAVAQVGIAGLSQKDRASLPADIQPADESYKSRLREAFQEHASGKPGAFDHFVEAQLVWDEGMAASAAAWLSANQDRRMVILAGAGHIAFASGIPSRLERRIHAGYAIVLNSGVSVEPRIADYILLSKEQQLPPAGILGAALTEARGECRVRSLDPAGGAEKAGIKRGDIFAEVEGQAIHTAADVRLAIWNKKPGDRIRVTVRRGRRLGSARDFEVELTAPGKLASKP
jgi:uncharacterized iron-regulated protein